MKVTVELTGTSPLLMHNPRMVDPQFEINRQLKPLTSKTKKTDEDMAQIARLEWHGGLYTDENGIVVQPTSKPRKCLIETARINKMGKQVERALSFTTLNVPLTHNGPVDDPEALYAKPEFRSYLSVGVGTKRIMRMRPQFYPWALSIDGLFIEDAGMNYADLERIVELAGLVTGIGDNRVNGYGRFLGKVRKS
jgi:hypothetical protein